MGTVNSSVTLKFDEEGGACSLSVLNRGNERQEEKCSSGPETSVGNYHYSLRNNPEERSFQLLRGVSLKSRPGLFIRYSNQARD